MKTNYIAPHKSCLRHLVGYPNLLNFMPRFSMILIYTCCNNVKEMFDVSPYYIYNHRTFNFDQTSKCLRTIQLSKGNACLFLQILVYFTKAWTCSAGGHRYVCSPQLRISSHFCISAVLFSRKRNKHRSIRLCFFKECMVSFTTPVLSLINAPGALQFFKRGMFIRGKFSMQKYSV